MERSAWTKSTSVVTSSNKSQTASTYSVNTRNMWIASVVSIQISTSGIAHLMPNTPPNAFLLFTTTDTLQPAEVYGMWLKALALTFEQRQSCSYLKILTEVIPNSWNKIKKIKKLHIYLMSGFQKNSAKSSLSNAWKKSIKSFQVSSNSSQWKGAFGRCMKCADALS